MQPCHRFFFAVRPPVIESRRIGLVRDHLLQGGTPVANDRLHLTLAITGDYAARPDDVIDRMLAIGGATAGDPFALTLDRASGSAGSIALRPSHRPAALSALHRTLDSQLRYWGLAREGWTFNPHVTLGYRSGRVFIEPVAPIGWQVHEMVLIHSVVGKTCHVELGRWALARQQLDLFSG